MNKFFLGALSASMLFGSTVVFAQGLPDPNPPVYGSVWTSNQLRAEKLQAAASQSHDNQAAKPRVAAQAAAHSASGG